MRYTGDRYGKIFPAYWTGTTGRAIQRKGAAAVILGAYLFSTRHGNMIGLYELPLLYIASDLPVLGDLETIRAALADLEAVDYARYDHDAAVVWVIEQLRIRCALPDRSTLLPERDHKHTAIVRLYHAMKPTHLLEPFYARYHTQMRLGDPRGDLPWKPKGLTRGLRGAWVSGQQDSRTAEGKNAATPRSNPVEKLARPVEKPKVDTLAALMREELLPRHFADESDMYEAAKGLAARHKLKYNGSAIRRAIDSARGQLAKRGRDS